MKKTFIIIATLCLALSASPENLTAADNGQSEPKQVKTGWTLSAMPAVSFSTDLGFQYGLFGHVYYHGDGSHYPQPVHDIGWEVSHFTKGRTRLFLSYDSKFLVPGLRVSGSVTYNDDPMYAFYGFNGPVQRYVGDLMTNKDYASVALTDQAKYALMGVTPLTQNVAYYTMKRNMLRVLGDLQGQIGNGFSWAAGFALWNFNMGDTAEKYEYDANSTLYNWYKLNGVIDDKEANGGTRLELKAGLSFDSRDREAAPNKGIWAEVYGIGSPDLFGDSYNYLKLAAHWRQYLPIATWKDGGSAVFAYHLAYQGTVAGEAPFYIQQNVSTLILRQMISEGMGSSNTIRGCYANRMIADGYAWANMEMRLKLVSFSFLNQYFYVAVNPFFDCGAVVQPYRLEKMALLPEIVADHVGMSQDEIVAALKKQSSELIMTAGCGVKIAWNENFIVSCEAAHNFNEGIGGPFWMSIGTGYCF